MPPDLIGAQGGRIVAHIEERLTVSGKDDIGAGIVDTLIDSFASRDRSQEDAEIAIAAEIDRERDARVIGAHLPRAELALLRAEVAAAPHRFVAREPVEATTVPVLTDGRLEPRPADLRVFSAACDGGTARALPAPLTRVSVGPGASAVDLGDGSKDTWLLP